MVAMMNMTPHAEMMIIVIRFTLKLSPKFQDPTDPKIVKCDDELMFKHQRHENHNFKEIGPQ